MTTNDTNNWRDQLAFLDNPTQGADIIRDRELIVRLLLAVMWTGNAYDSDTRPEWAQDWREGARLYDHASAALKVLGAQGISSAICENGEYTFGIDRPCLAEVRSTIECRLEDTYTCEEEREWLCESSITITWDGSRGVNMGDSEISFTVEVPLILGMDLNAAAERVCDQLAEMKRLWFARPFVSGGAS